MATSRTAHTPGTLKLHSDERYPRAAPSWTPIWRYISLVDLAKTSALLRYRTARDGVLLLEREPNTFLEFRLEATRFWCDVEPVVRAAHDDVLGMLA
ncbi:MAG: hypothetical protein ACRDTG_32145 [Pseudonocardiaceae bacterium]